MRENVDIFTKMKVRLHSTTRQKFTIFFPVEKKIENHAYLKGIQPALDVLVTG